MTRLEAVKRRILIGSDMDYAGVCPSAVLEDEPRGRRPSDLLPNAKSILSLLPCAFLQKEKCRPQGFVLRGLHHSRSLQASVCPKESCRSFQALPS